MAKSNGSSGNKPVHEIRMGRIKAAVWENETQTGTRHYVTLQRIYKDDSNNWQTSDSFGRDDLPLVAKVVDRAATARSRLAVRQARRSRRTARAWEPGEHATSVGSAHPPLPPLPRPRMCSSH